MIYKPGVHNVLYCRQRTAKPRPQVTCTDAVHWCLDTRRLWNTRADRHAYIQTDIQTHSKMKPRLRLASSVS